MEYKCGTNEDGSAFCCISCGVDVEGLTEDEYDDICGNCMESKCAECSSETNKCQWIPIKE